MNQPSIVFLNGMGHVEISWTNASREKMLALIEKKMAAGVRFFIVKPRAWSMGLLKATTEITRISQIEDDTVSLDEEDLVKLGVSADQIRVKDPDLALLAADGSIKFSRREGGGQVETIGYAKTASEVLSNRTVATPSLRGG